MPHLAARLHAFGLLGTKDDGLLNLHTEQIGALNSALSILDWKVP